jgi:predicted nucleic acid-binding protein
MCGVPVELVRRAHVGHAEHYGLPEIFTEDLQHDRLYGTVRVVNPFARLS